MQEALAPTMRLTVPNRLTPEANIERITWMNISDKGKRVCEIFLLCACLVALFFVGTRSQKELSKSGFYFDTIITVTLYGNCDDVLLDECFALADHYEKLFSTAIADSDISRVNAAGGKPVSVDDETLELIELGLHYCELSGGRFDLTIGQLSSLWDFSGNPGIVPDSDDIREAASTVDYHSIVIDGNTVQLTNPDAAIDLGGIAKGYIADKMKSYLTEHGVTSGIINLGGNVLTIGSRTDETPYTIGLQKPFDETGAAIATVKIKDRTVVSSGVYERCFTVDDTLYHHILDTSTGYPYDNGLLGVTIICPHSVDGDALSTTCFALGLNEGMKLIESMPDTEAVFITDDYQLHLSSGIGTEIPIEVLE